VVSDEKKKYRKVCFTWTSLVKLDEGNVVTAVQKVGDVCVFLISLYTIFYLPICNVFSGAVRSKKARRWKVSNGKQ
jgi:hypothetical protein